MDDILTILVDSSDVLVVEDTMMRHFASYYVPALDSCFVMQCTKKGLPMGSEILGSYDGRPDSVEMETYVPAPSIL